MILELNELKAKNPPHTYQEKFGNPDHLYVFADGSKDNDERACAAVLDKTIIKKALQMESSIFTAIRAIDLTLDIISKNKQKKFIIFSDSLYHKRKKPREPPIIKLLSKAYSMSDY